MGTLLTIALRNTLRHGRRTVITALVMMAGIGALVFFDTLIAGMTRSGVDNLSDYAYSSLKVRNPAYVDAVEASPLDKGIADPAAVLAALAAEGLPAAPRIRFVATVSNYNDEVPVFADGVDPTADAKVFSVARSIDRGSWLDKAPGRSVVLGAALARELSLKVGDPVLISAQTVDDRTNADEYTVAGLVDTPVAEVNKSGLFMSLSDARTLIGAPGLVTEVNAAMPRAGNLAAALAAGDSTAARLRKALPGLRVDPIRELAAIVLGDLDAHAVYTRIIAAVILLIAGVGIVNTMFMSVYSRVREIGVLRAYGMVPRDISRLFTLEGLMVGAIGALAGVLLGLGLDLFMVTKGISAAAFSARISWTAGVIRGEWNVGTMAVGFVFGVVTALAASIIPARKASRLEPTDALRFQ